MTAFFCFIVCCLFYCEYVSTSEYSNNCARTVTSSNGKLSYAGSKSKKVPEGINCNWTIISEKELYLDFESFSLASDDSFSVLNYLGEVMFGPFNGQYENVFIVTGLRNLTAVLITSNIKYNWERSFAVTYSPSCNIKKDNLILGVFNSPLYIPEKMVNPLDCNIELIGHSIVQRPVMLSFFFTDVALTDSVLEIESKGYINASFTGLTFPRKLLVKNPLKIHLTLNPTFDMQNFTIYYELVSEVCSEVVNLNLTHPTKHVIFEFPQYSRKDIYLSRQQLICSWVARSPPGTKIRTTLRNLVLLGVSDRLILSTPNEQKFPTVHLTSNSNNSLQDYVSPSNEFWVSLDTLQTHPKLKIDMDFSIYEDIGINENYGDIVITKISVYKLQVAENQLVQIKFDNLLRGNKTTLELYSDYSGVEPFLTLTAAYPLNWALSLSNQLKIIVKDFNEPKDLKISFSGTQTGCNAISNKKKGEFSLSGKCREICNWILPPYIHSSGTYKIRFNPSKHRVASKVLLHLLDPTLTSLISDYDGDLPDVSVPSRVGALLKITRNCGGRNMNTFTASYSLEESCNKGMTLSSGETVSISSPGYPNRYPVNSRCHWMLFTDSTHSLIHLEFSQFKLGESHTLMFKTEHSDPVMLSSENPLPDDEIFPGSLLDIQFQAHQLYSSSSHPDFAFQASCFDCGGSENQPSGIIRMSSQKGKRCIWKIDVPCEMDTHICNVLLKIVEGRSQDIEVFSGPSLRSPRLPPIEGQEIIISTSAIIIIYDPIDNFSDDLVIEYNTVQCIASQLCIDRVCMKPSWKCKGNKKCGYYYDNTFCHLTAETSTSNSPCTTLPIQTIAHSPADSSNDKNSSGGIDFSMEMTTDTNTPSHQNQKNEVTEQTGNLVSVSYMWIGTIGGLSVGLFCFAIAFWVMKRRSKTQVVQQWDAINPSFEKNCDSISN